ncbi:MAG: potassium-transporting ATPase subunit KdpA [Betaproteobacteria bacterium]|nr:potassium-transporting ATPase subunit KdpA [Betaproteobacteria bacterium]MBV9360374.1 potassium-transporting ATPase subunit KdpA [Betaproteobacteria bacterium]
MISNILVQSGLYIVVLLALAKPLGEYMARVFQGERTFMTPVLGWLERFTYRASGVDPAKEMRWTEYAVVCLIFNLVGLVVVYAFQRLQHMLPLNPANLGAVSPDSSWNTAVSFATNTNWQGYGGESTMSYLTQMLALAVQNFVSAAVGIAVLIAMIRGFTRRSAQTIGNFWVDLTRTTIYVLLPLSFVLALALVSQGVVQTFGPYATAQTIEKVDYEEAKNGPDGKPLTDKEGKPVMEKKSTQEQTLPLGPAASQIAIKQIGTNGGGFFNVNSAHPYENPTPLSNFLEMISILLVSAALCITFGRMVGDVRQGWAILWAMSIVMIVLMAFAVWAEQYGNPMLAKAGADTTATAMSSGGNMEGKEVRFGIVNSAIWANVTTDASNGSVNAMHDSFTPLGGLVPMWNMQLGEVIFGGVGSGLYGMIMFVLIAVFVAGLMIGRTPEYLGKKLESFEMKMASIAILLPPLVCLIGAAVGVMAEAGRAGVANPGAHAFSEILYAFSSAGNNNGSAFGGLSANTPFYNSALGVAMLFARYPLIIAALAVAGSLAAKKTVPAGLGTLPTHTPLFVVLLIGTVLLVGALTFVPALALGPIVEHVQMLALK